MYCMFKYRQCDEDLNLEEVWEMNEDEAIAYDGLLALRDKSFSTETNYCAKAMS